MAVTVQVRSGARFQPILVIGFFIWVNIYYSPLLSFSDIV
jgi:hypothetical protein